MEPNFRMIDFHTSRDKLKDLQASLREPDALPNRSEIETMMLAHVREAVARHPDNPAQAAQPEA